MCCFEKAITRPPCSRFAEGLTHGRLGKPDVDLARRQHACYVAALRKCGVDVTVLRPDNDYPDSCFVEDEAIATARGAILPSPCRPARQGEEIRVEPIVRAFYDDKVAKIQRPGTLEGGDICHAGNHIFIGISTRTNEEGARQMSELLQQDGYTTAFCDIRGIDILHLSTGMSWLGNNTLICVPEFRQFPAYKHHKVIVTPPEERYAANCVRVNDYVIMAEGFPVTQKKLTKAGFKLLTVPMSEFEKQDGGLSCLSLRIPKRFL